MKKVNKLISLLMTALFSASFSNANLVMAESRESEASQYEAESTLETDSKVQVNTDTQDKSEEENNIKEDENSEVTINKSLESTDNTDEIEEDSNNTSEDAISEDYEDTTDNLDEDIENQEEENSEQTDEVSQLNSNSNDDSAIAEDEITKWGEKWDEDYCNVEGNFVFELNNDGESVSLKKWCGTSDNKVDVRIPDRIYVEGKYYDVTGIEDKCFESKSINKLYIPKEITSIGDSAFDSVKIGELCLADDLKYINPRAINPDTISSIYVSKNSKNFSYEYCRLYDKNKTKLIRGLTNYVPDLPDTVTTIGAYSFAGIDMVDIEIPEQITTIEHHAFYKCTCYSDIEICENVTSVGDYAFSLSGPPSSIYIYNKNNINPNAFNDIKSLGIGVIFTSAEQYNNLQSKLSSRTKFIEFKLEKDGFTNNNFNIVKIKSPVVPTYSAYKGSKTICSDKKIETKDQEGYYILKIDETTAEEVRYYFCFDNLLSNGYSESFHVKEQIEYPTAEWMNDQCMVNFIYYKKTGDNTANVSRCYSTVNPNVVLKPSIITINDDEYERYMVKEISPYAFFQCGNLESITIEDGIEKIGESAFGQCSTLKSVTIGDSVSEIGSQAFISCKNLTDVKLPASLIKLDTYTFIDCESLEKLIIPDNVKEIESDSVVNCPNLKYIKMPRNIEKIGINAFYNLNADVKFYADDINQVKLLNDAGIGSDKIICNADWNNDICNIDNVMYKRNSDNTASIIGYTSDISEDITLKSEINIGEKSYKVTKIENNAFNKCSKLKSVILEDGFESVGDWAFCECTGLEKIELADSITNLGTGALALCSNLKDVKLSKSLNKIPGLLFNGCDSLENIEIPDSIIEIEDYAFINCKKLMVINIPDGVQSIGNSALLNSDNVILYVNSGEKVQMLENAGIDKKRICLKDLDNKIQYILSGIIYEQINDAFEVTGYTSDLKEDINLKSEINMDGINYKVTSISDNCFKDCENLESICIPDSISEIGESAFEGCHNLISVKLSNNIFLLNNSLFKKCDNLREIEIGDNTKEIGSYCFSDCDELRTVKFDGGVNSINPTAFENDRTTIKFYIKESESRTQGCVLQIGFEPENIILY